MPTVMLLKGWRFFFYSNENDEPIHIHCKRGDQEAKFWLLPDVFDIEEAFSYRLNGADRRFLREALFSHFDYLVNEWESFMGGKK